MMKLFKFTVIAFLMTGIFSCSAPKYTYYFSQYDYQSKNTKKVTEASVESETVLSVDVQDEKAVAYASAKNVSIASQLVRPAGLTHLNFE